MPTQDLEFPEHGSGLPPNLEKNLPLTFKTDAELSSASREQPSVPVSPRSKSRLRSGTSIAAQCRPMISGTVTGFDSPAPIFTVSLQGDII